MPKLPKRTPKGKGKKAGTTSRKYTQLALVALEAGLSWGDLRRMKFTHLQQVVWEWEDLHGAEYVEEREATEADVASLMNL